MKFGPNVLIAGVAGTGFRRSILVIWDPLSFPIEEIFR
jgi:hypothetical protein